VQGRDHLIAPSANGFVTTAENSQLNKPHKKNKIKLNQRS